MLHLELKHLLLNLKGWISLKSLLLKKIKKDERYKNIFNDFFVSK